MEIDFNTELLEKYSADESEVINALILRALEEGSDKGVSSEKWSVILTIEKHDALNDTYHINLYTEDDEEINVSYYCGVDVGCEMVDFSFDGASIKNESKIIRVLVDLKIDEIKTPKKNLTIAEHVLKVRKDEILDLYQKQSYDSYVTGGGTIKTNKHYKDEFQKYEDMGLFWECIYKDEIVERNLI